VAEKGAEKMRYLAIDHGKKRTGLAICDRNETICSPLTVISAQHNVLKKIVEAIADEGVEAVVLGLPLNMDGSEGPQAKTVRVFAEELALQIDIPIHFQDERLTSFAAEEMLAPAELGRKKQKKHLDAVAAAQILETFLESGGPTTED
jgi:putative Holliday junction resolvase